MQKEKSTLKTLSKVAPPLFQFLVQRQQAILKNLAEDHGFNIHFQSSKNYLVAESVDDLTEQNMDRMIEKFIQSIENVCDKYDIKSFPIEDSIWPYVEKDFNKAKSSFEESILQVYKKCEGTYSLIGLAENFGKYESLLSTLSRQYKTIRIENKELFDVLEMEKILNSRFEKVKVLVHEDLLLLNGEEKVVEECAKCYKELSKTENMHSALRVVSENVYEILRKNNIKKKINSFLAKRGFHIYWTVAKLNESCCLDCKCVSGTPEREADYLTSNLVKEIEIEDRNLQAGQIEKWIEEIKNAKLFISDRGLKTVVYYGNLNLWKNTEANRDQSRFWFNQTIASSELLTLLARSEVQNFINSKLQIHSKRWSIIEDKRKIRVNCQCLAEVDHLVSLILDQVWCVSRPAEVCQNDPMKQFLKDYSNFVEIKKDEKYCTFYVTVDLQDELGRLLGVQDVSKIDEDQNDSEICNEIPTERVNVFIEPDIKIYLFKRCNAQLTKISEDFNVGILYKGTSLELKGTSKEKVLNARQALLKLLNSIVYQKDIVRIKRQWDIEMIDKLEENNSCTFMLSKKDEEPEYLKCWDAQNVRIVAAEGRLEDTMCDVLVCFLDQNLQPVGSSSKKIFMTGKSKDIKFWHVSLGYTRDLLLFVLLLCAVFMPCASHVNI